MLPGIALVPEFSRAAGTCGFSAPLSATRLLHDMLVSGSRTLLVSGVSLQSFRDLHKFGCNLHERPLTIRISRKLGNTSNFSSLIAKRHRDVQRHLHHPVFADLSDSTAIEQRVQRTTVTGQYARLTTSTATVPSLAPKRIAGRYEPMMM